MELSESQRRVLLAITAGQFLKSHRDIEGHKAYQLHALDGSVTAVEWEVVEALTNLGLIDSNKKFPAATYWLTDKGRQLVATLGR